MFTSPSAERSPLDNQDYEFVHTRTPFSHHTPLGRSPDLFSTSKPAQPSFETPTTQQLRPSQVLQLFDEQAQQGASHAVVPPQQCLAYRGEDLFAYDTETNELSIGSLSFLRKTSTKNVAPPRVISPLSTFPCLPRFKDQGGVSTMEVNASGSCIAIVGKHHVRLVRLPMSLNARQHAAAVANPAQPARQPHNKAGVQLYGAFTPGSTQIELYRNTVTKLFGAIGGFGGDEETSFGMASNPDSQTGTRFGMRGALSARNDGTAVFSGQFIGIQGEFVLRLPETSNPDQPFAAGSSWSGECKFYPPGLPRKEREMRMTVDLVSSAGAAAGDAVMISCSVGDVVVESIHDWLYAGRASELSIVHAAWHPHSSAHFLVLASDNVLRMYDTRNDLDEPVFEYNLSTTAEPGEDVVSFCFSSRIADTTMESTPISYRLWKRTSVFGVRENGQVFVICPFVGPDLNLPITLRESQELVACVETDLAEAADSGDRVRQAILANQLNWTLRVKQRVQQPHLLEERDESDPLYLPSTQLLAEACPSPSARARGQHHSAEPSTVCGICCTGSSDGSYAVILRSWTCGRVDTLVCGSIVEAVWTDVVFEPTPRFDQQAVAAPVDDQVEQLERRLLDLRSPTTVTTHEHRPTPTTAASGTGATPTHTTATTPAPQTTTPHGDRSPYKNLSEKIRASLMKRRMGLARDAGEEPLSNDQSGAVGSMIHRMVSSESAHDGEPGSPQLNATAIATLGDNRPSQATVSLAVRPGLNPVRTRNAAKLVHCLEVLDDSAHPSTQFAMVTDTIFNDIVLCLDQTRGELYALHLTWLNDLNTAMRAEDVDTFVENTDWKVNSRKVLGSGVCELKDASTLAIVTEPSMGHWVVVRDAQAAASSRPKQLVCTVDLTVQTCRLRFDHEETREPLAKSTPNDDGLNAPTSTVDQLLEQVSTIKQALDRFTAVPAQLRGLKFDFETPDELGFAASDWLVQVSQRLMHEGGDGNEQAILKGIMDGYKHLSGRRREQEQSLEHQKKLLQACVADLANLKDERQELQHMTRGMYELQALAQEGVQDAVQRARRLRPTDSAAKREYAERLRALSERATRLQHRIGRTTAGDSSSVAGGLQKEVADVVGAEQSLQKLASDEERVVSASDGVVVHVEDATLTDEHERCIKELQMATEDILARVLSVEKGPQKRMEHGTSSLSVQALRKRLNRVGQDMNAVASLGVVRDSLVILVGVRDAVLVDLNERLMELRPSCSAVQVDRYILGREYQSAMRRDLDMDVTDCPYSIQMNHGGDVVRVHIALLYSDVLGQVAEDTSSALARDKGQKLVSMFHQNSNHPEFESIGLLMDGRDASAIKLCNDNREILESVQDIVSRASMGGQSLGFTRFR